MAQGPVKQTNKKTARRHVNRQGRASRGATAVSSASERSEAVSASNNSVPVQKNSVSLAAAERSACAAAGERTHMRHTLARCRARRTDALTPTGLTSRQRTGHATDPMCLARPAAPKGGHTKKQTLSATWRRNGPQARDPRAGGVAGPTCAPWPRRALHPLTDAHSPGEHPASHAPGYTSSARTLPVAGAGGQLFASASVFDSTVRRGTCAP